MSGPTSKPTVFVVDDDPSVLKSICALVGSFGLKTQPFSSAVDFLDSYDPQIPGCLVTDVRMLEMSGLELQERLIERGIQIPAIVISGYADTSSAVRAMKNGAVTFLEKPYRDSELWKAIGEALVKDALDRINANRRQVIHNRLSRLSPGERSVLRLVLAGKLNKQISSDLGVSMRTVEARRKNLFDKMEVHSVAELVKIVMEAQAAGALADEPETIRHL